MRLPWQHWLWLGLLLLLLLLVLLQIATAMDKFEKQFEDLDVRSGYMESAIDA